MVWKIREDEDLNYRNLGDTGMRTVAKERTTLQEEKAGFERERETKDDGRYIIFYTFAERDETPDEEGKG